MSQIWVGVLDSGPSGYALNSSFNSRSAQEYKHELGQSLVDIARVVPDGILVFFASYAALAEAVESWQAGQHPSIWCVRHSRLQLCAGDAHSLMCCAACRHRLARLKHLVVEPRDQSQFAATRTEFEDKINGASNGLWLDIPCRLLTKCVPSQMLRWAVLCSLPCVAVK
jgi:regulator of telomere elongation helicase 1